MYTALLIQWEVMYVAQCLEYDVVSQWYTQQEALENLKEAVELYLEEDDSFDLHAPLVIKKSHLLHFDLSHA